MEGRREGEVEKAKEQRRSFTEAVFSVWSSERRDRAKKGVSSAGGAGFNKAAVSLSTDEGSGEFVRGGLMRKRNLSFPWDRSVSRPAIRFSFGNRDGKIRKPHS